MGQNKSEGGVKMNDVKMPKASEEKTNDLKLDVLEFVNQHYKEVKEREEEQKKLQRKATSAENKVENRKIINYTKAREKILSEGTEKKGIKLKSISPNDLKKAKAHTRKNKKMRIAGFIPIAILIGGIALATGGGKEAPEPAIDTQIENPISNPDILNIIETKYNENITNPEEQIHQEDLTVVREFCGDGQVYERDGKYYQDYLAGLEPTSEGTQWIEAKEIKQVLAVLNEVDPENKTAITALMEKSNGEVVPLIIETMTLDGKHPITKAEHYLQLKDNPQYLRVIEAEFVRTREEQQEKVALKQEKAETENER